MPHIVLSAVVGLTAYAAYRLLAAEIGRVGRLLAKPRAKTDARALGGGTLVRGADGVYRPKVQ